MEMTTAGGIHDQTSQTVAHQEDVVPFSLLATVVMVSREASGNKDAENSKG
jgi:hypothetical protein